MKPTLLLVPAPDAGCFLGDAEAGGDRMQDPGQDRPWYKPVGICQQEMTRFLHNPQEK